MLDQQILHARYYVSMHRVLIFVKKGVKNVYLPTVVTTTQTKRGLG